MNTTERIPERIALIDMDGTLCDYDLAMRRDMLKIAAPGEPIVWYDDAPAHMIARKKLIQDQPGWWENLEPIYIGMRIAEYLALIGYQLTVLTKGPARRNPNAWTEKKRWCTRHLPGVPVTITEDKGLVYGRILVDDWPAYVLRWLEWRPRGLVLMPAHPWNEGFSHPNVLRVELDGSNLGEAYKRVAERDDIQDSLRALDALDAATESKRCWQRAPKGAARCSLAQGHNGEHVAHQDHDLAGEVMLRWPLDAATEGGKEKEHQDGVEVLGNTPTELALVDLRAQLAGLREKNARDVEQAQQDVANTQHALVRVDRELTASLSFVSELSRACASGDKTCIKVAVDSAVLWYRRMCLDPTRSMDGVGRLPSMMAASATPAQTTTVLPDGSAASTMSVALPKDHWLYAESRSESPMPMRVGLGTARSVLADQIRDAARYAVRASTMNGKEDIDPDSLVQNVIVGLLGYWTEDGLRRA